MATEQFVVFQLAKEEYAIPISQVKEIIRYGGATKLPNAPSYMDGIISLRGKILSVFDLAGKFSLPTGNQSARQVLIVEAAGQEVGLIVDAVTEVLRLEEDDIEVAEGLARSNASIRAIGKVEKRLLIILALDHLFTLEEMSVMKNAG